jgi:ring-1,2-phenylacetyl-CoA epoxidase subunit PaaC
MSTSNEPNAADWSPEVKLAFVNALLAGADDDLMLGHAGSEWTGLAPILEEDIAVSSIAQDEIAHARELYEMVAGLTKRTADELAYARKPEEYRCCALVIRPDEFDWAYLIARQFYADHFDALRLARWQRSSHRPLANLAHRIAAEEVFHVHHVDNWLVRLGRGDAEAKARLQKALDDLWPSAVGQFERVEGAALLETEGLIPAAERPMFEQFAEEVGNAMRAAGLKPPSGGPDATSPPAGGRCGRHGAGFAAVLDDLCAVYRLEPDAAW